MATLTVDVLKLFNPTVPDMEIRIYLDNLALYSKAKENVQKNGAITLHPRTGEPINNPYLRVMKSAEKAILGSRIRLPENIFDHAER